MSGEGIADVWSSVEEFRTVAKASGIITRRRAEQAAAWMWDEITETLIAELKHDQRVQSEIERLESEVRDGTISPSQAARLILQQFTPHRINDGTKTSVL
jgi:LAO/AO transport system kinase